jgi:low temperature requirement protein LtrA
MVTVLSIAIIVVSCILMGVMWWIYFECDYDMTRPELQENASTPL